MKEVISWLLFLFLMVPISFKFTIYGLAISLGYLSRGTIGSALLALLVLLITLAGGIGTCIFVLIKHLL